MAGSKKNIIKKWYEALGFPTEYDTEFYALLDDVSLDGVDTAENYVYDNDTGKNLCAYLYFCEAISHKYKEHGISDNILMDTLSDIVVWTNTYYGMWGKVGFAEVNWIRRHLTFKLFKLGRLQFEITEAERDMDAFDTKRGEPILAVHIPGVGPLSEYDALASFEMAKEFFKEYFPDYKYKCFTCHSWLLDPTLKKYLREGSNILRFAALFTPVAIEDSDTLLKYIFRRDTTRESVAKEEKASSFAVKIADAITDGEIFHEVLGARK